GCEVGLDITATAAPFILERVTMRLHRCVPACASATRMDARITQQTSDFRCLRLARELLE
ncbi:MAG TPA: hypothetical protein VFN67_11225, partial [Polyangiales bacterium]|nr:hypothetical protein [Polyangiales bacterium]